MKHKQVKWEENGKDGHVKTVFMHAGYQLMEADLLLALEKASAVFCTILDEQMVKALPEDAARYISKELFRVCGTKDPYAWEEAVYEVFGSLLPDFQHTHHYCSYDLHVFRPQETDTGSLEEVLKRELHMQNAQCTGEDSVVKFIPCVRKKNDGYENYWKMVFPKECLKFYGKNGIIQRFVEMLSGNTDVCLEGYMMCGGAGGNFSHDGMDEMYYTLFDGAEHWKEDLLAEKNREICGILEVYRRKRKSYDWRPCYEEMDNYDSGIRTFYLHGYGKDFMVRLEQGNRPAEHGEGEYGMVRVVCRNDS